MRQGSIGRYVRPPGTSLTNLSAAFGSTYSSQSSSGDALDLNKRIERQTSSLQGGTRRGVHREELGVGLTYQVDTQIQPLIDTSNPAIN